MVIEKLFFSQHLNRIMKVAHHKIKLLTCHTRYLATQAGAAPFRLMTSSVI